MRRSLHRRELVGRCASFTGAVDLVRLKSLRKRLTDDWSGPPTSCKELLRSTVTTVSTIAVCISTDGHYLASTHGDHTVKVFNLKHYAYEMVRQFRGHPRTPWVVKFHPANSNILASGCIGHEVRVWYVNCSDTDGLSHVSKDHCAATLTFPNPIISLSFSIEGDCLAIASSHEVYYFRLWGKKTSTHQDYCQNDAMKMITHSRTIHAVVFHPRGSLLLVAASDSRDSFEACDLKTIYVVKNFNGGLGNAIKCIAQEAAPLDAFPRILEGIHLYTDSGLDCSKSGDELLVVRKNNDDIISEISSGKVGEKWSGNDARLELYSVNFERLQECANVSTTCDLNVDANVRNLENFIFLRASFVLSMGFTSITSVSLTSTTNVCLISHGKKKKSFRSQLGYLIQTNVVCQVILLRENLNTVEMTEVKNEDCSHKETISMSITQNQDEVNVAKWGPLDGSGIFYGSKDGKVCCIGKL